VNLRVGMGYDVHPAIPGKRLRLGGVSFPDAGFALAGHSDADVIIHAACDALLGAAGLPDIGHLFPNTARKNHRRNSLEFLSVIRAKFRRLNIRIVNVDCTLIAETPKISSQVGVMRKRMAKHLGVSIGQMAIKATTNEGLGFIGRGQGLAAMAVALLALPA
jgi:2-C-methyl-D-erythritol 2,4-cyclodiphosphate synthase